jgi:hypothetical protein
MKIYGRERSAQSSSHTTDEQKPRLHPDNPSFLDCTVTGDESWVFQYDPETKRQSTQWTSKISPRPKKFRLQNSKIKTMLITFSDKQGVTHKEFVPEGQRVNSAFYVEVIGRLLNRISEVRSQFRAEGSWFLLHDNAPSHSALVVKTFLTKHGAETSHPPYSPELASPDFFLFATVKTALKGKRFQDVEDIKKNVTAELNAVLWRPLLTVFKNVLKAATNVFK